MSGGLVVLTLLVLGVGFGVKSRCLRTAPSASGRPQLDWSGGWPFSQFCYSDVITLYGLEQFDKAGTFPYKTSWVTGAGTPAQQVHYTEYPVLTGLFMWINAKLTHAYGSLAGSGVLPARLPEATFFDLVALWLALAWVSVVLAVTRLTGPHRWDAALVAASPILITQAFTNFDPLAVAFATTAMLAWARCRPGLAGVLLGLGGAAKLYPLFLLVPLLALCWRGRKLRPSLQLTAGAAGAWILVNAPIAALFPHGWAWFFTFSQQRGTGFESLWAIASTFTHWGGLDGPLPANHSPTILNTVSGLLFIACCLGIVALAKLAPRRPRVPQLCLLTVVAFLLTSKIYSPQYSLWLIPLAVLACPRPWLLLSWMTVDALIWIPTMLLQLPSSDGGISLQLFSSTVLVRDALLLAICAAVLRDIIRPERDLVRRRGVDDPCGGVLNDAAEPFRPLGEAVSVEA